MSDKCTKENELGKITAILDRIESDIYGNGNEGILKSIPRIEGKINELVGKVDFHTKIISDFIEFQAKYDGEITGKERHEAGKRDKTHQIFVYSMIALTVIGLFFAGYKLFNKIDTVETTVKNEIRMQEGISKTTRGGYVKYNDNGISDSVKIK